VAEWWEVVKMNEIDLGMDRIKLPEKKTGDVKFPVKEKKKKQYLLLGLVALLLVFSGVQAVQINEISESVDLGGSISGASVSAPRTAAPQPAAAPTMVGGC
jgi:hypothetical protein